MFGWCSKPSAPWRLADFERIPYRLPPVPPKLKTVTCRVCGEVFEADARANSAAACSDRCRRVLYVARVDARYARERAQRRVRL